MKDLDFDEIDRAVNSLNATKAVVDENANTDSQSDVVQSEVPTAPSLPLAGRRSSGQFMDVVHPSSDMRRVPLVMPERASMQNPITNKPVAPTISSSATEGNSPASAGENNGWPDPIDFTGPKNVVNKETEKLDQDQSEDADIDRISDDIVNELNQKSDELPDSPFISGTKVDKRPLGAFSTEPSPETPDQMEQAESTEKNELNNEVKPTNNDKSLPDELQNDLLHIESDDNETVADKPVVEFVKAPVVAPVPVAVSQPAAPSSIVQQYKEQPSTGEKNSGAIYDTDAYHKALVVPAKKKSGWMWVLWIFILIVVGVGAGAAVYFYVLPLL